MAEWLKNLLVSVVLIAAAVAAWLLFSKGFRRYFSQKKDGTGSIPSVVYSLIKALVITGIALMVLQINGVNVSGMLAGLGIVSAVIGLAFQDLLKDVIMGVHILTDDFFKMGEVIRYGDTEGKVISYNLRVTKLQILKDNSILTICNRNISEIAKVSHQVLINLPLSYEEDPRKIHRVLGELCGEIAQVEGMEDCLYRGTQAFEESAVLYRIELRCPPDLKWPMWRAAHKILQEGLAKNEIKIPYNQLDVHLPDSK